MVRNVSIDIRDPQARAVFAVGNDYPDGSVVPPHQHRQGQLISGASGTLIVSTPIGTWVMPPQRGMWIPPGVVHDTRMLGAVSMESIFLEPGMIEGMPNPTFAPFRVQ